MRGLFLLACLLILSSCAGPDQPKLRVAVSANMQFAMEEIVAAFEASTLIAVETIVSSSGKLTAQIMEGAPYDIFVSADVGYPNQLFEAGLTTTAPLVYAKGQLIFWSLRALPYPSLLPSVAKIALPNPKLAPYGKAALKVLESNEAEVYADKLVYGSSVSQVNQFILSNAVDAAYTASSTMTHPSFQQHGYFTRIDTHAYDPIEQAMVVMKKTDYMDTCKMFLAFMQSKTVHAILRQYDYIIPNTDLY